MTVSEHQATTPLLHSIDNMAPMTTPSARVAAMIGQVVVLMANSPQHRYLQMGDIDWAVLPPLVLDQFRMYLDEEQKPIAFVAWAYLSAEAEGRMLAGGGNRLAPNDWRSGDRLWIVDAIAPGGREEQVVRDALATAEPGTEIKVLRRGPGAAEVTSFTVPPAAG